MTYYLYIKTHNKTGLRYLGKTTANNPHKYLGSGKYWRNHLKKHGYDYTTEILLKTKNESELIDTGLYFSKIFNVIKSNQWANLKDEEGNGGWNIKHIMKEKYNVDYVIQHPTFKQKQKETFQNKFNGHPLEHKSSLNEKYKETLMSKYGVDHAMKSQEIKDKARQTVIKKYGVDNISKLDSIKEKKVKTNLEKFGCKHPNKGRIIITNGKKNKFCNFDDIPEGWWKGKTSSKKD